MSEQTREFYIAHVVAGESGKTTVVGRAGDLPIPVGTQFTLIYKQEKQKFPEGFTESPGREKQSPICITVLETSAYGKHLEAVPGNSTGSIVVGEKNADVLLPGWMLSER